MKFGEFAEIQPQVKLEKSAAYTFIEMADVEPNVKHVKPSQTRIWNGGGGAKFEDGDVIFARITPCLEHGKTARINGLTDSRGFGSTEFFVFRARDGISDPDYLYYLSRSPIIREPAIRSMIGASGRQRAQKAVVENILVSVPPISEQHRIASILSAYDDLIENNRRRMALLEESARLLYREWFVYLRFPGHEHTRIVDGVPEGWERKTLDDLCTEICENILPDEVGPDTPYIGLEHMPRRSISLTDWGNATDVNSLKHRYKSDDILFGKIRPYFHKVGIAFTDGIASSDAIVIRPKSEKFHSFVLMTVSSDNFVLISSKTAREGSKMPRADWKLMTKYDLVFPPNSLLETFSDSINLIVEQLRTLCFQNIKLREARDLLLPRLMNGEIPI